MITDFALLGRHKTGFPLPYTKEYSLVESVESTFETSVIEIDKRLYQYSGADLIKWQEKGKILVKAWKL